MINRRDEMLSMRENNMTLQEIADKFTLSRERVRQIIGNTGRLRLNKKKSGLYAIRNKTNGRTYIGSSINTNRRISQHFSNLKHGRHHSPRLQKDYNLMGESAFEYSFQFVEENKLMDYERYFIDKINPFYNVPIYNIDPIDNVEEIKVIAQALGVTLNDLMREE